MGLPVICCITATKNRHTLLERVVRFMLNQTYTGKIYHLIFNNSSKSLRLNNNLSTNKFILINKFLDSKTGKPYTTLGGIYNDAIKFIPEDTEVVSFVDDDDIFLPNHIEEGLKGLEKGGLKAYKPSHSYFKERARTSLVSNVLEPSIFVKKEHILEHGFSIETTAQHLKWVSPLVEEKQIFVDKEGIPTYICDWSQQFSTFKTSGDPHNPNNFNNYSINSQDNGDGIITPFSNSSAKKYYSI